MNIEGNEVVWKKQNFAITKTRNGFSLLKQVETKNEDGTSFRFWVCIEDSFEDFDSAKVYAEGVVL